VRQGDAAGRAGAARGEDEAGGIDVAARPVADPGLTRDGFAPAQHALRLRQGYDPSRSQVEPLEIRGGYLVDDDDERFGLGKNGSESLRPQLGIENDKDPADEGHAKQRGGELAAVLQVNRDPVAATDSDRLKKGRELPRFIGRFGIRKTTPEAILEKGRPGMGFGRSEQQAGDTTPRLPTLCLSGKTTHA
jgi:hypothetical protein